MPRKSKPPTASAPQVRVAIYTRQSVASDLEFGSIDAQRELVEAFVLGRRSDGWLVMPDRYDDHGYSGSNTDRPALQRLIADTRAGKIDVIATYRFDRISRSVADFTALMALLDKLGVAFCSVTQAFDIGTSTGKFFMNMLASFSEFERTTIAERTRDKIAATRKKGMWTGGRPILGYDAIDKMLIVNAAEAETVHKIFGTYVECGGLIATVAELERRGIRNKSWTNKAGIPVRGAAFNKTTLHALLTNPIYTGRIRCGDQLVAGRHEAIIDQSTFDAVARALREHRRSTRGPGKWGAILGGLLRCARCGAAMTHAANVRGQRVHRYYACTTLQKRGAAACSGSRAPAAELEEVVLGRIRAIGTDPSVLLATLTSAKHAREARQPELIAESRRLTNERSTLSGQRRNLLDALQNGGPAANTIAERLAEVDEQLGRLEARRIEVTDRLAAIASDTIDEAAVREALADFTPVWDELLPKERQRILHLLVDEVRFDGQAGEIEIAFRDNGIKALGREAHDRRTA